MSDIKDGLVHSLRTLNEAVLDKVDGVDEYELRRPRTRTGTNLLGLVKHLATVQAGYFGDVFGRPWPEPMPWDGPDSPINADMYATATETSDWVRDFYRRSWAHAEQTFAATALDEAGTVPWWPPERRHPTLHTLLVHMINETARHAGHLDILREQIDGEAGRYAGDASIPGDDEIDWAAYIATVEAAAVEASDSPPADPG
ncbi:MAG: DinB family protein [Actinomycetota bacterium]